MVAVARDLLGDAARAEDVAQDGVLAALQSPPEGPNVRGWFRAVARNLARTARRGEVRRGARERAAARPEKLPPPSDRVARVELQRLVVDAVLALPEPYRSTVIARYLEERSVAEIAAADDVSRNTVKTRLRRALVRLRERLDVAHDGNSRAWSSLLFPMLVARNAAASAAATKATGAILMGTKGKLVAGALLAAGLLALLGWKLHDGDDPARGRASAREHAARVMPREVVAARQPEQDPLPAPVDLAKVDRDRDLHGIVVDRAGAPVAGAVLQVVHHPWKRTNILADFPGNSGVSTTSARDGTFRLTLRRGALVNLRARAKGLAPLETGALQAGEKVRVVLDAPASLTVTVLDHRREPVADTQVSLLRAGEGAKVNRELRTGPDGVAVFADLPRGVSVTVLATHPEHGALIDDPEAEAGAGVEIVLPQGIHFSGQVIDAETKAPVAGARVGMNWFMDPAVVTDAAGRFRLNGHMGRGVFHAFHVTADGYARSVKRAAGATTFVIELGRGARFSGRVVNGEGRPVGAARVGMIAEPNGSSGTFSNAYATSESDGRFECAWLAADLAHVLTIAADGLGRATRFVNAKRQTAEPVDLGDIVLVPGHAIEGVLLGADGLPVPRHEVILRGPRAPKVGGGPSLYARGNRETRRTDDLGRFRFRDLPSGHYELEAEREGGQAIKQRVLIRDRDVRDVELRFDDARTFTVFVTSERGGPVSEAVLRVRHEGGSGSATTNAEGVAVFQVKGVVRELEVWHVFDSGGVPPPPFGPVDPKVNLSAATTEMRLVLPVWERVGGRALLAGKPIDDAVVEIAWKDGSRETHTSSSGHFRDVAPPGTPLTVRVIGKLYEVRAGAYMTDHGYGSKPVQVVAGDLNVALDVVRVKEDRTLTVHVLDPNGAPLAGARVGYWPRSPQEKPAEERTNARGTLRLEGLPAREVSIYALVAEGAGFLGPRQQELIPNGQTITMRCRAARRIRGRVVQEDGTPAPKARLDMEIDGQGWGWNCDKEGRFDFPAPGATRSIDFTVTWEAPDGTRHGAILKGYSPNAPEPTIHLTKRND